MHKRSFFPFFETSKVRNETRRFSRERVTQKKETRRKTESFKEREANDAAHASGSPRPLSSPGLQSEGRISSVLSPLSSFFRLHRARPLFSLFLASVRQRS